MIYEWYSGSDSTGAVPRGINEYASKLEEPVGESLDAGKQLSMLTAILKLEHDQNWQGYLLYYMGSVHLGERNQDAAAPFLRRAVDRFDTLAGNFRDVRFEHASSLFYLLMGMYASHAEGWVDLALRLVPFIADMKPSEADAMRAYSVCGYAFYELALATENMGLYVAAREFLTVAHHIRPEAPEILAGLVYASYGAGDVATARKLYEMYCELDPEDTRRADLEEFAKAAKLFEH